MSQATERKGPASYRFFVLVLNILLGILVYWLLGFILDDISDQPGPSLTLIQEQFQNPTLIKQRDALKTQNEKIMLNIEAQRQQQSIIQTSINSYRDTMNQLLDLQKASVQKGMNFSTESQQNLSNVTKLYLDYQQRFQNLNQSISTANEQSQQLQTQINSIETQLSKQSDQAYKTYEKLYTKHNLIIAGLQLLVLVPLLLITAYFYKKHRQSVYISMITAIGIAISLKIIMVMHEHFPSRVFKYILILVLIYFVVRVLIGMLRMVVSPKPKWLLNQYREAYQKLQCPICQFSIQPGKLKFFTAQANQRNPAQLDIDYLKTIEEFTCPSCGEHLYEKCKACEHTRYSLLTFCDNCGVEKQQP